MALGFLGRDRSIDAVEIDEMALESSRECASLNSVSHSIRFLKKIPSDATYQIIIANILRNVLLEFGEDLMSALEPGGILILSGLLEDDARDIRDFYSRLYRDRFGRDPLFTESRVADWFSLVIQSA